MPDPKRDVERLIEDGLIRYGGGDLAGALAAWERALIQDPGNTQAVGYIDYVRHVFEQLNRPTRDELVVPFGLGHGDQPDYQIEISPEPPDDDALQPSAGLQDGWLISQDDERDTLERLYSLADPPGTLDLEYDEDEGGGAPPTQDTEDTTDFGTATPVVAVDPNRLRDTRDEDLPEAPRSERADARPTNPLKPAAAERPRARVPDREDDDAFEGPELEVTPGFLEAAAATPGFGDEPEVTPGFSDAGAGTGLKRPELGFVQPRARRIGGPRRSEPREEAPSSAPPAPAPEGRQGRDKPDGKASPSLSAAAAAAVIAPAKSPTLPPPNKPAAASGPAAPARPAGSSGGAAPARGTASPSSSARGALDPWAALREGAADAPREGGEEDGGDAYANFELAPLIEELPPSTEPPEPEPAGPRVRAETATRDLGLAGRYRPRADSKFTEEAPTRELMRHATEDDEKTQAWAGGPPPKPAGDPLETLAAQILPRLERDAAATETRDDRLRRRITSLVEYAGEWSRLGELPRAVAAADLALAEDPDSALAQKLVHRNRDAILGIFQTYLGSLERRPALARGLDALGTSPIGARAAFLLSRVDGHLTFDEILDVSGMPRLEAYRYLCQLLIRGILTVE